MSNAAVMTAEALSRRVWGSRVIWTACWFIVLVGVPILVMAQDSVALPDEAEGGASGSLSIPDRSLPFAYFEERLRQSERWRTMTEEERQAALQKIADLRRQYLGRQQRLKELYEPRGSDQKTRKSFLSRRRKIEQAKRSGLWERFQSLPLQRRLAMEKELKLNRVLPSQRQQKFDDYLDQLPFSKRERIITELTLSGY